MPSNPCPVHRRRAAAAPALLLLVACHPGFGPPADAVPGWSEAPARRTVRRPRVGPRFDLPALHESSGLVASARVPGLLWTMNDGGNPAELFAVAAATGRVLGRVRVTGARNEDWEALAQGPCGPGAAGGDRACLYVGDVGDNAAGAGGTGAGRPSVTQYRVPEPVGTLAGPLPRRRGRPGVGLPVATAPAAALAVRYADGPRDVEAMAVLPDGATWLVTKQPTRRPDGSVRPALVYRVGAGAWEAGGVATARLVDSLPIVPDGTVTRRVTDAALDADRRLLAVRTYTAVYLVPLAGPPWRIDHGRRATVCEIGVLREPQGEGIAVVPAPEPAFVLSSESNLLGAGGLATARCPAP